MTSYDKKNNLEKKKQLFLYLSLIRKFFTNQDFLDVLAPPMVSHPGIEAHIHPFKVQSTNPKSSKQNYYLNTSPEFYLKNLLSQGMGNLFSICYSHRDEPISPEHRPQFMMLEWYKLDANCDEMIQICIELLDFLSKKLQSLNVPVKLKKSKPVIISVAQAFEQYCDIDILNLLDSLKLRGEIESKFSDIHLPSHENCEWDDYFFLLFLNKIEPHFKEIPQLFLKDFPAPLAALSQIKPTDSRVAERFEWYINGQEIGNCFKELQDLSTQRQRFIKQSQIKKKYYQYELPQPHILFEALEKGLPDCSGIAIGLERLFSSLTGYQFPFTDEAYL